MRVLCSTTANDGHFGPLLPFAQACAASGHDVRVAAPASYSTALSRAGLAHEPFADAPTELIGAVMATLPDMGFEQANDVVISEIFGRIDAQAALPDLLETVERWRPDVVLRESAELASLAAAERFDIPHVHVCVGMRELADRFAAALGDPLDELGHRAGMTGHQLTDGLAAEDVFSVVPLLLDSPGVDVSAEADTFHRFSQTPPAVGSPRPAEWGDTDRPLIYVTFGSVAGSLPSFVGIFQEALDALADLDATVLMTVGRRFDIGSLRQLPDNAQVVPWLPQETVLPHAMAMLGHGGLGTTLGALAVGVPQVVAPLFAFDQLVNGRHVAAVGAGLVVDLGAEAVTRAATEIPRLLNDAAYAESASRVAVAMRTLPPPSAAVPLLTQLTYTP